MKYLLFAALGLVVGGCAPKYFQIETSSGDSYTRRVSDCKEGAVIILPRPRQFDEN